MFLGTSINGSIGTNVHPVAQFSGLNFQEEAVDRHKISLDRGYPFGSRFFSDESPLLDNTFLHRSRNNSNEPRPVLKTSNVSSDEKVIS